MYALDKQAAMSADATGKWLNETGKYIGKILCAEDITAGTGTRGVALTLQADDGRETRQFVYTMKADGEQLSGYGLLMALMTCVKVRDIKPTNGPVRRWDSEKKEEYTEQGIVFAELANRPLGFLLQKTEEKSRKNAGETAWTAKIVGVFEASTELTASEILTGKKTPVALAQKVVLLTDRPMKARNDRSSTTHAAGPGSLDDDIPF